MDANLMNSVLALGQQDTDPQLLQAKRQQRMIDMLRQRSMEGAPTEMAGRVVSPNFGQVGANLIGGMTANKMQPGVDQALGQYNDRNIAAKRGYMDALMMALRRQPPQAGQTMLPPDGMEDR